MTRDFKGIWIPKHIWLADDLGWSEKLLLVEIDSLDQDNGCFASNEHFAQFFGLSKDRISKMITALKRKGYITVELTYKQGTKQIDKRIIRVVRIDENACTPIGETDIAPRPKQRDAVGESSAVRVGENAKENNTCFRNTVNNTMRKNVAEQPMQLANYLYALIQQNNPYARQPNLETWANDLRLMHEMDGIAYDVIRNAIHWCQHDDFWHKHILSARKLREKFPTLYLQAQATGGNRYVRTTTHYTDGIDF